jgi:LPS sulfotransferase NodH
MQPPKKSYVIWFSQRVGSTCLGSILCKTGIAGYPNEWFNDWKDYDFYKIFEASSAAELRDSL